MMGVYTGSVLGALTWITGSRGTPNGAPSIKNLNAIAGQTYNFFVGFNTGDDFFGGAISADETHQADYGKFSLQITGTVTDPYWSNVKLLCDFDGANNSLSMIDVGPASHGAAGTRGQAHLSTETIWTGSASLSIGRNPSSQSGVWWPFSADWQLGSGPFTIECWAWWIGPNATDSLVVGQWSTGNTNLGWRLYINGSASPEIFFDVTVDGSTVINVLNGSGLLNNAWIHIAVDFDGTTYRLYVGGVTASSTTLRNIFPSTLPLSIGLPYDDYTGAQMFRGNIDGLRITKGVARFAGSADDSATLGDLPRANIGTPFVGSIWPNAGPPAGGTSVVITGLALTGATAVKFGATNAASFTVNSDTKITATSPVGSVGAIDVTVTTSFGTSQANVQDKFNYTAADPSWANVVLLMGFEGLDLAIGAPGMSDESPSAHGVVTGGVATYASVSTLAAKFGSSSPGSLHLQGDSLTYPDSTDWALGSGRFTIECFVLPTTEGASSGTQFFVGQFGANAPNLGWVLYMASGVLKWNVSTTGSDNLNDLAGTALPQGSWSHVCVDYDATTYRLYVNGAVVATSTTARNIFHPVGQPLGIGANSAGNAWWYYGFIDELRITKGVARYAGAFTVPAAAFPRHA